MTTQRTPWTPYNAELEANEKANSSAFHRAYLKGQKEGYLRAIRDYAPLLDALRAIYYEVTGRDQGFADPEPSRILGRIFDIVEAIIIQAEKDE